LRTFGRPVFRDKDRLAESDEAFEGILGEKKAVPLPINPLSQGRLQIGTAKVLKDLKTARQSISPASQAIASAAIIGPRVPYSSGKNL
jgi:hypothetical protein